MCLFCTALGTVLMYVTIKTNSIWPAAFMHAVNNSVPSVLFLFMKQDVEIPLWIHTLSFIPLIIIALLCFWLMIKRKSITKENTH